MQTRKGAHTVDHLLLTIVIGIVFVGQLKAFRPFLGRGRPKTAEKVRSGQKTKSDSRTEACAQLLIHIIAALLAPGCVPLFLRHLMTQMMT